MINFRNFYIDSKLLLEWCTWELLIYTTKCRCNLGSLETGWCLTLSPGKLKRDVLAGSAINSMEWNDHMNEYGLLFLVLIFWVSYIHNEESSQAQVVWKVPHLTGLVDKVRGPKVIEPGQQQSECCKSLTSRSDVVYIKE